MFAKSLHLNTVLHRRISSVPWLHLNDAATRRPWLHLSLKKIQKQISHTMCIFKYSTYTKQMLNLVIHQHISFQQIYIYIYKVVHQKLLDSDLPAYWRSFSLPHGAWALNSCTSYTLPWITTHNPPSLLWFSKSAWRIMLMSSLGLCVYFSKV